MVSHWSLSVNKFPQVSRTFPSILANLDNTGVWTVSTHPLISMSLAPLQIPLGIVPSAQITIAITVTFIFQSFILVLLQDLDIHLSFRFLLILLCGLPEWRSLLFGRFSLFIYLFIYFSNTRSGRDEVVCFHLNISKNFKRLILLDGLR